MALPSGPSRPHPPISVSLAGLDPSPHIRSLVPLDLLRRCRAFPVAVEGGHEPATLVVAMVDPGNLDDIEDLAFASGMNVRPLAAEEREILIALGLEGAPDVSEPIAFTFNDQELVPQAGSQNLFEAGATVGKRPRPRAVRS